MRFQRILNGIRAVISAILMAPFGDLEMSSMAPNPSLMADQFNQMSEYNP